MLTKCLEKYGKNCEQLKCAISGNIYLWSVGKNCVENDGVNLKLLSEILLLCSCFTLINGWEILFVWLGWTIQYTILLVVKLDRH